MGIPINDVFYEVPIVSNFSHVTVIGNNAMKGNLRPFKKDRTINADIRTLGIHSNNLHVTSNVLDDRPLAHTFEIKRKVIKL